MLVAVGSAQVVLPNSTWEIGELTTFTPNYITLNSAATQGKGLLRCTSQNKVTTLEASFTFQSSCQRTKDNQGIAFLLSKEPIKTGPFYGAQDLFEGAMVSINHRSLEIGLISSPGKAAVKDADIRVKCHYASPQSNNPVRLSLSQKKLTLFSGADNKQCGSVDFSLDQFYIGLSSFSGTQACANTIFNLTIYHPDPNPTLTALGEKIKEMEDDLTDVIGEINELVDEFS